MSREAMLEAKELIKQKRYDEARFILKTVDHPTAQEWLAKIDQIAPPKIEDADNPFANPFEDPFSASIPPRATSTPPPPKPDPQVWVNDKNFARPATKKKEPQLSNGVMILAVGAMLIVGAIILGLVVLLGGAGDDDADSQEASNDDDSIDLNFGGFDLGDGDFGSFDNLDYVETGSITYGDVRDNTVPNSTGHIYRFQGNAGDRIDIAIQTQWDSLLELRDQNGNIITQNDDEAGGEFAGDARLYDVRLTYTGEYQIVVRPWAIFGGAYRLWLTKIN